MSRKRRSPARTLHTLATVVEVLEQAGLRDVEGRRHSQADQQHLNSAVDHLVQAGAELPDAGDDDDVDDNSVAVPTMATANDRYKAALSRRFASLRAETRTLEAQAAPSARVRTLEESVPPNPYAKATEFADAISPHIDPAYDPRGHAPNGYAIALAARRVRAEDAAPASSSSMRTASTIEMIRDQYGVPDPYATALARRK